MSAETCEYCGKPWGTTTHGPACLTAAGAHWSVGGGSAWIDCRDRLPHHNHKVLVYVPEFEKTKLLGGKNACVQFGWSAHRWYIQGTNSEFNVTHWMELPSSPNDGGQP